MRNPTEIDPRGRWALDSHGVIGKITKVKISVADPTRVALYIGHTMNGDNWSSLNPRFIGEDSADLLEKLSGRLAAQALEEDNP